MTDLIERIVFYDDRATEAKAVKRADGKYEVTLAYEARKIQVDGKGVETPRQLDDWMEVGVFARRSGDPESKEKLLHLSRHRITQPKGTFTVIVDEKPFEAGIDPLNKLIDRVPSDNRKKVDIQ